jgi:hypothetical protein
LASVSFGLSLAAVLWFYRLIRSWKTVTALLAVTIAVRFLASFSVNSIFFLRLPTMGKIFIGSFVMLFLQLAGFLHLLVPKRGARWVWLMALRFSAMASLLLACVVGLLGGGHAGFSAGNMLIVFFSEAAWQTGLALVVGITLCAKRDSLRAPALKAPENRSGAWPKSRFAVFPVLVGYLAVVGVGSNLARERAHNEKRGLQERRTAEIAQSLAEAPSLDNLPQLKPQPLDQLLVQVAGWTPYYSGSYDRPAEPAGISGYHPYAPYPHRLTYYVYYAEPGNNYAVKVDVTQYPNPNWAKYEVRNTPTPHALIDDGQGVQAPKQLWQQPVFGWC